MPRLRRTRYLTCFYCGRKTSTVYDGRIRHFDCPRCDATNYLDENGDITDPPVATDKEATPRQFAVPRSAVSPPSSPTASSSGSGAIFCATCLKNQHLLSASLAQYLPDPDDPDYAEREKGLYRFRRNQERLYPQICAECEPRVRQRLEQAAYTAKTDLLRRMLDQSTGARKNTRTAGPLEVCNAAGRWLWAAGFVLQLVWHAAVVHELLTQYFAWAGADEGLSTVRFLRRCGPWVARLPSAERLLWWSAVAGVLGVWWNPRFAQIFRGFTRHISGVSQWYLFQVMSVAVRFCLPRVDLTTPDPQRLGMQLAGHAFAAGFALLIMTLAPRAIKINMAPLFGASSSASLRLHDPPEPSSSRHDETKSIADLLDEISRSPISDSPPSPVEQSPSIPRRSNLPPMGHTHTQAAQTLSASLQQINTLNLSHQTPSSSIPSFYSRLASQQQQPYQNQQEDMDWSPTPYPPSSSTPTSLLPYPSHPVTTSPTTSPPPFGYPTTSPHRAFNTQGQRPAQPFGGAPTEPSSPARPFWYRVPPAPTTPAQRVFNPPNRPGLRASPVDTQREGGVRFRGDGVTLVREAAEQRGGGGSGGSVAFAEPSFFADVVVNGAGGGRGDPRNELSGMFGEGFRLDGGEGEGRGGEGGGWFRRLVGGGGENGGGKKRA